jgi:hypothetical protein
MKSIRIPLIILIIALCNSPPALACTTAIISGKSTTDGRPLLIKHRDADELQNKLMFFSDGTYDYIGLVNAPDSLGNEVWAGCNSAGFAIMNSASYNLKINDTTRIKDQEGFIMKHALQTCATLQDFEKLLRDLPKPLGVESNFGVIDAQGGAAYYETTNFAFTKIDASNPTAAPFGYLIRTNFSFSGTEKTGYGYIRYDTANELFYNAAAVNNLSLKFLLQDVSRNLTHSLTGNDLIDVLPQTGIAAKYVFFQDYIPRHSSATTVVIQGLKKDEPANLTTMWTILGFPLCSVAIPTWLAGGELLPKILLADQQGVAPLCDMALILKRKCFPIQRGSGKKYLNLTALINQEGTGILQKILPFETEILQESAERLKYWRRDGFNMQDIQHYYGYLDQKVMDYYRNMFDL